MRKKFRVASGADLLAARKRQALKPGKVLSGKEAFGIMEHVVLGDEVEDKSDSSLQELANAALKSLSEFQIKVKGFHDMWPKRMHRASNGMRVCMRRWQHGTRPLESK